MTNPSRCVACGAPFRDATASACTFCGAVREVVASATMVRGVVRDVLREDRDGNGIPDVLEGRAPGPPWPRRDVRTTTPQGKTALFVAAGLLVLGALTAAVVVLVTSEPRPAPPPPVVVEVTPQARGTTHVSPTAAHPTAAEVPRGPAPERATPPTSSARAADRPATARPTVASSSAPTAPPEPERAHPISMVRVGATTGYDRNALNRQLDALDVRSCGAVVPQRGGLQLHYAFQTSGDRVVISPAGSTPGDFAASGAAACITGKVTSARFPRGAADSGTFSLTVFYTTT